MVTVRVSETYDLSTQVNKMGVIGIHTPQAGTVTQMYTGLVQNHRFARLVGCDVTLACASMLPADPLQIGTEAGSIAPQDMFNPILYTAVSNDSFNTIQRRIMNYLSTQEVLVGGSITQADFDLSGSAFETTDFDLYYGLLADSDGWKKAMPQSGLKMEGLYPIVYQVVNNFGTGAVKQPVGSNSGTLNSSEKVVQLNGETITQTNVSASFRGPSMRMPRIPLHIDMEDINPPNWFPTTYVACIIVPPAKLNKLYYRMKVTWTVEFSEVCPVSEYGSLETIGAIGRRNYGSDYVDQSSKMDKTTETVDVYQADVEHVMTSGR